MSGHRRQLCITLVALLQSGVIPAAATEEATIIVALRPHLRVSARPLDITALGDDQFAADRAELSAHGLRLRPMFSRDAATLARERTAFDTAPRLERWARIELPAGADVAATLALLRRMPSVETAYIKATPYPAGFITPGAAPEAAAIAPNYVHLQQYLADAPAGVSAKPSWQALKITGKGITVADVEGDWTTIHRDIAPGIAGEIDGVRAGSSIWYDHGTAEVGIVGGRRNAFGITGIAYRAQMVLYSIFRIGESGSAVDNIADAVNRAAAALEPGDVMYLPIEYREELSGGRGFAVEYYDDVFEAVQAAVAKGIVVVAAAGNGGLNLDSEIFGDAFDRAKRDSGAIIVGAGGIVQAADRQRLSFSNYGSRVDVQAAGTQVVSSGYGDLYNRKGLKLEYTASFNGTSSATGIVAGVAALLQQYAKETLGRPLTPAELRDILVESGSPQRGNKRRHIGPRPDVVAAIAIVDTLRP